MKALLPRLYFYYFYGVLAGIFLLLYPIFYFLLQKEKFHPAAQKLRRFWAKALFVFTGMRCRVRGFENIDWSKTYVIVANHTSPLDIPALCSALPLYMGFLAKAELSRLPLLRIFFRTIDIEVERGTAEGGARSYKLSVKALQSGKSLVIFPEGGILPGPEAPKPFKEGAFRIAVRNNVPILPVSLPNTHRLLPDEARRGKPGRIDVILHPPIPTSALEEKDIPALMEKVRVLIQKDLDENRA